MGSSGQSWGATLRVPILARGWSRPGCSCPVSTSAAASPAPEKTGSAQSPQEACVRSLPTPGPLQNANSPLPQAPHSAAGTLRPTLGWPCGPTDRLQPSPAGPAGGRAATGGCPAVAWPAGGSQASGLMPSSGFSAPASLRPEPGLLWPRLNQNTGSGVTQRSPCSALAVGRWEPGAGPSDPGRTQSPSLTRAVGPESATPTTPGSHLLSSPHLPATPSAQPQPSRLRGCQPLGPSYPGQPVGGRAPLRPPRPPRLTACPWSPGSPLGRSRESSEAKTQFLRRPALLQARGRRGKEKRAEHFMARINQRGKSSRRNKKLPSPGHRDLPGSSPRCPKACPPPCGLPPGALSPGPGTWAPDNPSCSASWGWAPLGSGSQFPLHGHSNLRVGRRPPPERAEDGQCPFGQGPSGVRGG